MNPHRTGSRGAEREAAAAGYQRQRTFTEPSIGLGIGIGVGSARPNPSLNRSTNGGPPGPGRWYAVHFHRPGPGVPPLAPG
jgi:hypothetical protein